MEDGNRWRQRAAEMRNQAAQSKEPFIADGFLTLAVEYERLAEEGARWIQPQILAHDPVSHSSIEPALGRPAAVNSRS